MKVDNLIDSVSNISGWQLDPEESINSSLDLINSNEILKGINEAQNFMAVNVMPNEFNIPISIDLSTDVIGNDLINLKLSSYNEGAQVSSKSTIKWKEFLSIPWRNMVTGIKSLKRDKYFFSPFGIVYDASKYTSMCSLRSIGEISVNKIKSASFEYDNLSTFKTVFKIRDSKNNIVGVHSVTVNSNTYRFSTNFINISVNFSRGLITASYTGKSNEEYRIEIQTLRQPNGVLYYNNGVLRIPKTTISAIRTISAIIRPYSVYEPTQEVPAVYTHDLLGLLEFTSALEVQRFNKSLDQNLANITSNKISEYQNKERFETRGRTQDLNYWT